jgi:hypothetical protein
MSKPHWDDAPGWANWLCQDEDGDWNWFEFNPEWMASFGGRPGFWICTGSRWDWARKTTADNPPHSLEARP